MLKTHTALLGPEVRTIPAESGWEFAGPFQSILDKFGIHDKRTPPYMPQYDGVHERSLGLLRDKTVALLRGEKEGTTDWLWAEALNYACDISSRCFTTSVDQGATPYGLWYGRNPSFDGHVRFGTVGYMRNRGRNRRNSSWSRSCTTTSA